MPTSGRQTSVPHAASAKALVKGLAVVECIAASTRPVTLQVIAAALGIPRTTAQRLLQVLVELSIVQGDPGTGYSLGPQLAAWGSRYVADLDVLTVAAPFLKQLGERTRETVYLGVRLGRHVLYLGKHASSQPVQPRAVVGMSNPLHSTAIGKALLCWSPQHVRSDYLAHPLEAKTERTITRPADLGRELQVTAERGYSVDDIENEDGVRCVAAPVMGPDGFALAAISVSAPAYRFRSDAVADMAADVMQIAAEVSTRCGAAVEVRALR